MQDRCHLAEAQQLTLTLVSKREGSAHPERLRSVSKAQTRCRGLSIALRAVGGARLQVRTVKLEQVDRRRGMLCHTRGMLTEIAQSR